MSKITTQNMIPGTQVYRTESQEQDRHSWSTVAVSIFDANGVPADAPTGATMQLQVRILGSDKLIQAADTLDVAGANGERSFTPFFQAVAEFILTPSGLGAGQQYKVTITSSINAR